MVNSYLNSLIAGGAAGTAVDVILFPLDTLKTRLQSGDGFWKSGGFKGLYRGIGPTAIGSAPGAALFFGVYDTTKERLNGLFGAKYQTGAYAIASISGEMVACLVRVPVEILKQRRQTCAHYGVPEIAKRIYQTEGFIGFYRGYTSTILREIPCSLIQLPVWEHLKIAYARHKGSQITPGESSVCGAIAGGISAFLTTPLDVAKTRIMLADSSSIEAEGNVFVVWRIIFAQNGFRGLFAGALPRTVWISIGGSIFFGTYELVKSLLQR